MHVRILVCLYQVEDLVYVASDGYIIYAEVAEDAIAVDDICGTKGRSFILRVLQEAAIVARDYFVDVDNHRYVQQAKVALFFQPDGV